MIKTFKTLLLVFLISAFLPGCGVFICGDCDEEDPRLSSVAISELNTFGVSIAPIEGSFPENPNTEVKLRNESYVEVRFLRIIFSLPPVEFTIDESSNLGELVNEDLYEFYYSEEIASDFRRIEPIYNLSEIGYINDLRVYGIVDALDPPVVLYNTIASIPFTATHIEMWQRSMIIAEPVMVRRVPLRELYGWKRYFQPIIGG